MRGLVLKGARDLSLEEVPIPKRNSGEALVRVHSAGICGSDVLRYRGEGLRKLPLIPGHEISGIVEDVGSVDDKAWIGAPVAVYPVIGCGKCHSCKRNWPHLCEDYDYVGSRRNGGMAEFVRVPISSLFGLSEPSMTAVGVLMEPVAVAVHAIARAGVLVTGGVRVVIRGGGTIGLLTAALLASQKCVVDLVVSAPTPRRLQFAESFGFNLRTLTNSANRSPYDVAFECTGQSEGLNALPSLVRPRGAICLVGTPSQHSALTSESMDRLMRSEISVLTAWNSVPSFDSNDWIAASRFLHHAKSRIEALGMIRAYNLADGVAAIRDAERKQSDALKIVLRPRENV